MRRISLYFLSFFFLFSTNFVLLGDYHIGYGDGEPPRDPVQDVRDRCNIGGGSSESSMKKLKKIEIQNIELSYDCSDQYYSPEEIVQNFCRSARAKKDIRKYMKSHLNWGTPESSLNTVLKLREKIDAKYSLRLCVREGANRGRKNNYFDDILYEYTDQLKLLVEQRRIQRCLENKKKNYKEILRAHRSQALGGDDLAKQKLVDYGEKLIENFDANDISREKFDRVIKTLQNNGAVHEKRYQTGEKIKSQGEEYGISSDIIEVFSGNELQHYFHEQVITSLDCSFAISPSEIKTLSIGSAKCAYAANVAHEYELADAALGFTDSLLYLAKRAGTGILKGGIDFSRAVSYLLGNGELPRDTSSISEIFAKIKEQPLEGVGDALEYAIRTVTFGGAVFVSYLLGLEVAVVGITAAKGIVGATQFLEPFSVGISPSGAATLEYSFASAKDFVQASVVALGQAAQGVCGIAEQCGHLFAAGNGGPSVGVGKESWTASNGREIWFEPGKIGNQMKKRGWAKKDINDILTSYKRRFKTTIERWSNVNGENVKVREGEATVFFKSNNEYVVIGDKTNEIIQVSDKFKADWSPSWSLWTEF